MTQQYYTIVTTQGAERIAKATALGTVVSLTHMAVGDGGGQAVTPSTEMTELKREVYRAAVNLLQIDENNQNQIIAELIIPEEDGDFTIREVGLFAADGALIAVGNLPDNYKPRANSGTASQQIVRMIIKVDNAGAVALKVDPAVVLATREFVDGHFKKILDERGLKSHLEFVKNFATRGEFVSRVASLGGLMDGQAVIANGLIYKKNNEAKIIPDLPGWEPVNESFGHYDEDYQNSPPSRASCMFVKDGELIYNLVCIENLKPDTIKKVFLSDIDSDLANEKKALKEFSREKKLLINCDGFESLSDGRGKVRGLQIVNAQAIKEWDESESSAKSAIVMFRDGYLRVESRTSARSAKNLIDEGAVWSAVYGNPLISNGEVIDYKSGNLSARTIIGQKENRDILILCVEGRSGEYGATYLKCAEILKSMGCVIAYALDGGGSSQIWWGDAYAMHSSDQKFQVERKLPTALEINAEIVEEYETEWVEIKAADGFSATDALYKWPAIAYRQKQKEIELRINISGAFKEGETVVINSGLIPDRIKNVHFRSIRGNLLGANAAKAGFYAGAGEISVLSDGVTPYLTGGTKWMAKDSKGDYSDVFIV